MLALIDHERMYFFFSRAVASIARCLQMGENEKTGLAYQSLLRKETEIKIEGGVIVRHRSNRSIAMMKKK